MFYINLFLALVSAYMLGFEGTTYLWAIGLLINLIGVVLLRGNKS